MIQANELRIGNYCMDKFTKEYLLVDEIVKGKDDNHVIGFFVVNRNKFPLPTGWEADPVPLTPDILEKAGFNRLEGNQIWEELKLSDFEIVWWVSGLYFITTDGFGSDFDFYHSTDEDTYWMIRRNIKYLHQLQNLYFALTGTELTINFNS